MGEFFDGKEYLKQDLRQQLEVLFELQDSSIHHAGQASVENKNNKALQAIKLANYVAFGAAGWAFNHIAGYALDPEADEDQHEHEIRGSSITDRDFVMRGETFRPALAALLRSLDGILPKLTARILANALVALNTREVHPILRPIKGRHRKKSNSKWNRQLEAVCWLHRLRAAGTDSKTALEMVHNAFGYPHSTRTIPKWQERLPGKLGSKRVKAEIELAKEVGKFVALSKEERATYRLSPQARQMYNRFLKVPLHEAGQRYQKDHRNEEVQSA